MGDSDREDQEGVGGNGRFDDPGEGPSSLRRPSPRLSGGADEDPVSRIAQRVKGITKDRDYVGQLASMITELGLTDSQAKLYFSTLDHTSLDAERPHLEAMSLLCKYQGFSPRDMIQSLLTCWESKHSQMTAEEKVIFEYSVTINGEERVFTFSSDEKFNRDIEFICVMFITRGTAFAKISTKSLPTMVEIFNMLKAKYNVNTTKRTPGKPLDSKIITIPRIAACFPNITVDAFNSGFGRSIVDPTVLFPDVTLPRAIFSPMMPSMVSTTSNFPISILLAISVRVDDLLHQIDTKTSLTNLHQYLMASYNATAVTESVKIKYCQRWKIVGPDGKTYPDIIAQSIRAKVLIRQSRPNDSGLEQILSLI